MIGFYSWRFFEFHCWSYSTTVLIQEAHFVSLHQRENASSTRAHSTGCAYSLSRPRIITIFLARPKVGRSAREIHCHCLANSPLCIYIYDLRVRRYICDASAEGFSFAICHGSFFTTHGIENILFLRRAHFFFTGVAVMKSR